jgi:hypothetical protein
VIPIKTVSTGSRTKSSQPASADIPTAPSKITRTGVKQQSAAKAVPISPVRSSDSFFGFTAASSSSLALDARPGLSSARVIIAGQETGMADTSTCIFRASLRGRLYRDVELPSGKSLENLAAAVVSAFGFGFDHAFGFYSDLTGRYHDAEERYELFADLGEADEGVKSVRRTKLGTAFPGVGKTMLLLFDYGDEWHFKIELIGLGQKEPKVAYPRVVKQVGEAPPQYPDLDEDVEGEEG